MAVYYDFTVPIPEEKGKIYKKTIKGVTYINYEYDRVYMPEKKYNIPKRTTIGKSCEDDSGMMYPNPNYLKYFPDAKLPEDVGQRRRSSCLKVGTVLVIRKLMQEISLDRILTDEMKYNEQDAGLFLDLAAYYLITEDTVGQYYPDYAYNHPFITPGSRIYKDSTVSEFIHHISADTFIGFQNAWNSAKEKKDRIYISCGSADRNRQAGDIDFMESGNPKDNKGLPIVNYAIAYGCGNREPLFYEDYPGSIVDVPALRSTLESAKAYGYTNTGFILDRGCFSKENIRYMDSRGLDFVIMMEGGKPLIQETVKSVMGTFEDSTENTIQGYNVNGTTVRQRVFPSDEEDRFVHIYYSCPKAAEDRERFEARLKKLALVFKKAEGQPVVFDRSYEMYYRLEYQNEGTPDQTFLCAEKQTSVIEEELKMFGYFCIITSSEMSAREAIELYKRRDDTEKLFRADKTFLGDTSLGVHPGGSVEGNMLIAFAALIIRNRMYTKLKDEEDRMAESPDFMDVPCAIRELEMIEMIRQADGIYRLDHALTATQKAILKAFGLGSVQVKKLIQEICDELRSVDNIN